MTTAPSTPFPAAPYDVACHAGQAARAELAAAQSRDEELYHRGRKVLATTSPAQLADMLDNVHAALYSAHFGELEGAHRCDLAALEDAAGILRNAGRR